MGHTPRRRPNLCHFDRHGEIQPTVGFGASRCLTPIYRLSSASEFRGYGSTPEHGGIRDLVGSLVARLARDDTISAGRPYPDQIGLIHLQFIDFSILPRWYVICELWDSVFKLSNLIREVLLCKTKQDKTQ